MIKERLHSVLITESEINIMSPLNKECAYLFNNRVKDCIRVYEEFIENEV